ncbi:MFS transporter [Streptomyces otsuchiensis]|uniref:MFS transporter n=1 Tax=Streptomyces otsuchiensis TaxID=2681388 RepID=UPI001D1320F9|nr:MFS transporter [Streptomyces otsuchiensis]
MWYIWSRAAGPDRAGRLGAGAGSPWGAPLAKTTAHQRGQSVRAAELGTPIVHALLLVAVIAAAGAMTAWWDWSGTAPATRRAPRGLQPQSGPPVFSLLRTPGVAPGLFISLALLSSVDLLTAYLPLIAEQRGISPAATGVLLALRAAFSIASRLLLATLLTRWSRRTLVVSSALGSAVSLSLVALPWADQWWLMAPAPAVGGFLLGIGQPLTMTSVVLAVPTHARGTALALRLWANRLGQVALPAGAGGGAGRGGPRRRLSRCVGFAVVRLRGPGSGGGHGPVHRPFLTEPQRRPRPDVRSWWESTRGGDAPVAAGASTRCRAACRPSAWLRSSTGPALDGAGPRRGGSCTGFVDGRELRVSTR